MITDANVIDLCAAIYESTSNWDAYDDGGAGSKVCYGIKRVEETDIVILRGSNNY